MLKRTLCLSSLRRNGGELVPSYLGARDRGWLGALIEEHRRFAGRRKSELLERLREPLDFSAPRTKLAIALRVLDTLTSERPPAAVPPREARALVLRAASGGSPRKLVLEGVSRSLGILPEALEHALFADLPGERRIGSLPAEFSAAALALEANLKLVRSLLARATRVRISAWGGTRLLVQHARRVGLICSAFPTDARPDLGEGMFLEISGPFELFKRTRLYAHALSSLVSALALCPHFELRASCALTDEDGLTEVVLRSGDPIGSGSDFGSDNRRLLDRFAADFRQLAPDWQLVADPDPIAADGALMFADFELIHRGEPASRWLLEVVGYWTAGYLETKLRRLASLGIDGVVLCVDAARGCDDKRLPESALVLPYLRRIDAQAVLDALKARLAKPPGASEIAPDRLDRAAVGAPT